MPNTFKKTGPYDALKGEYYSLKKLEETKTIRVPKPLDLIEQGDQSLLITEYLPLSPLKNQRLFGAQLARLHQHAHDQFGFDLDNTIGASPQYNPWTSDWTTFWINYRLKPQMEWTHDPEIIELVHRLIEKLPPLFQGLKIIPSLLHGDLWTGNVGQVGEDPVIFDPSSYYGHNEAEFSIMHMFGGFTPECMAAYQEILPFAEGFETRNKVYQLYHWLNHYNIFGSGYRSSCIHTLKVLDCQ